MFPTAQKLGIKNGDIMDWNGSIVEVVNIETVPLTRNMITVRYANHKDFSSWNGLISYCCADSLTKIK